MSEDDTISCCESYLEGYMEDVAISMAINTASIYGESRIYFEEKFKELDLDDQTDFLDEVISELESHLISLRRKQAVAWYLEDLEKAKKNDDNNS